MIRFMVPMETTATSPLIYRTACEII